MFKKISITALLTLSALIAQPAMAESVKRSLCVFDVVGRNGDTFQMMRNYALAAKEWGVDFELKPYTDEALVVADFRAGQCDAVELFGIKNRDLLRFPGSLDMMAALPSYDALYTAVSALSAKGAADHMRDGDYETVGFIPGGMVYLFSHDRDRLADWEDLAGLRITVLSDDEQAVEMIRYLGGSVLPASVSTFSGMFNNKSADISYAPAFAYEALEMYKGLGEEGGILNYNLGILTFQINIQHERFPEGFGQKSRAWVLENMWDDGLRIAKQAESKIPEKYWVELDKESQEKYNDMFTGVRQNLYEDNEVYDREMQKMLKKIRCRELSGNAECSDDTEGGPAF